MEKAEVQHVLNGIWKIICKAICIVCALSAGSVCFFGARNAMRGCISPRARRPMRREEREEWHKEMHGTKWPKERKRNEIKGNFLWFLTTSLPCWPFYLLSLISSARAPRKITDTLLTVWLAIMRLKEAHPARNHRCLRVLTRNHRTRPVWLLCARMDFAVVVFSFLFRWHTTML